MEGRYRMDCRQSGADGREDLEICTMIMGGLDYLGL